MIPQVFGVGYMLYEAGALIYEKGKEEGIKEEKEARANVPVSKFVKEVSTNKILYGAVIVTALFLALKKGK